ncbi:MAG TPA: hypothetical protein VJI75_03275 [Candidatus Nanoarchaeia archaeon]|nr:hypothetical protein [Candidatus Nanoarchaeia archaeon]
MVNQSKTKDPRFWKRWEASGAIGSINTILGWKEYMKDVGLVRKGLLVWEYDAKRIAHQYGFSKKHLEEALVIGGPIAYETALTIAKRGFQSYEEEARQIAERFGISTEQLDNINIVPRIPFSAMLSLGIMAPGKRNEISYKGLEKTLEK